MCDCLVALHPSTANGGVIFAKNSDRDFREPQHLLEVAAASHSVGAEVELTYISIPQIQRTNHILISKPHWVWGAEMGANEHGLMVGNEAVFATAPVSMESQIIGMDYVRLALERSRSVDEAIYVITELLREYGQGGNCGFARQIAYNNSYLLVDRLSAKVLETVDREWVVRSVEHFDAISNLYSTEVEFDCASAGLARFMSQKAYSETGALRIGASLQDPVMRQGAAHRRERALELLCQAAGAIQVGDIFGILRDHLEGPACDEASGPRICAHRRDNPIGQTTASWVTDARRELDVHWTTGTSAPCTGLFKPVFLVAGLPDHGPQPVNSEDQSLWWQHEQLRAGLEKADASQREHFMRERDDLEGHFVAEVEALLPQSPSAEELGNLSESCWRRALAFEAKWLSILGVVNARQGAL